jgi:hypothetical protein
MENMELLKAMQKMVYANQAKIKAEMKANREEMMARMEAKMDGRQEGMKAQMSSLASRVEDNENFEALQGTLVFQMELHQEKMEDARHSIRYELEETIQHRMVDVLSCVDQKKQSVRKELSEKKPRRSYRQ